MTIETPLPPGTEIPDRSTYVCPCGKPVMMQCTDRLWRCARCALACETAIARSRREDEVSA